MKNEWLEREYTLIGEDAVNRLLTATVLVFGCGGVGGYAIEAFARCGVGTLAVVDSDTVQESNLNRQIIATRDTIGMAKTTAIARRIAAINPECRVIEVEKFADSSNIGEIIGNAKPDYIVDAIDCVTSKILIVQYATEHGIPLISSMVTGNKLDASRLKVMDLAKTTVCPLARVMRRELGARGIRHLDVLSSDEMPVKTGMRTPASISFVPSVAGLRIAGHCVRKIIGKE